MDSEESLSDVSTEMTLEKSNQQSELRLPRLVLGLDRVSFIKRRGHYVPAKQLKLKNSLLAGVGLLELANAADFAANVWNQAPPPTYAVVLMAVGGTVALSLSYFAFKDAKLSWHNLLILREERDSLRRQKTHRVEDGQPVWDLDTRLNVIFRERGTEFIGRFGMDVMMGFGAVIIGIGTLMAIGGANRRVWHASNLLSGYIGNVPIALYSVFNAAWSIFVWMKVHNHLIAGDKALRGSVAAALLKRRVRIVQTYAVINGVTSIFGGAGSLISATRWWGYVILVVVIISSMSCNYVWRHGMGYDRPFVRETLWMSKVSLVKELEFVASVQQILKETPSNPLCKLISDSQSVTSVIEFIVFNDLFEDFCDRLLHDTHLSTALFGPGEDLTIDSQILVTADKGYIPRILEIAQTCVSVRGPIHFQYRERYLAETLGSYLCLSQGETSTT
jgi:hypothetical protein